MMNTKWMPHLITVTALLVLGFWGCGTPTPPPLSTIPSATLASAGPGESEIIFQNRPDAADVVNFYVDGELKLSLDKGQEAKIIIPDGHHTFNGGYGDYISETIEMEVASSRITFRGKLELSGFPLPTAKLTFEKVNEVAIASSSTKKGLDGALERAAQGLTEGLKKDARIAIINISSGDTAQAEFITEEIEVLLVKGGFTVVDRRELDRIRKEQNFQLTGDVDDDSIVSIGKFAGADIVITGSVSGANSTRRLRLRALNTQTAQVMAAASEAF
ncbi:CsgG/HfaB family protein [Breznakiellaceae bacterium SP9]